MITLKEKLSEFKSIYAVGKHYKTDQSQIKALLDKGALIDDDGQIWIPSKTKLVERKL